MSNFALLTNGIVTRVVVADSISHVQAFFPESEIVEESSKTKTAYVGEAYDLKHSKFMPPQPFPSWTFDQVKWEWTAPTSYPTDGQPYYWDEESKQWFISDLVVTKL
jgi:hypothetical protein